MKKKVFLSFSVLTALFLSSCGPLTPTNNSSSAKQSSNQPSSQQPSSSSRESSNEPSSSSSSSSQAAEDELYYSVPFGNGVADGGEKWTKGKTYSWTFTNCAAQENVSFAIGAMMSSSSHSSRSLYTNSSGADSSDTFESNSANDGTPRLVVKINNVQQTLVTSTYEEMGLTNSELNYVKIVTGFSIPAGNVEVSMTTHANAGYRLIIGGEARLYYPKNGNNGGGNNGGNNSGGTNAGDVAAGAFSFDSNQLNTPQEIHTTNQKAYLNYSGEYYKITKSDLDGFDAQGNKNVSTPLQTSISWNHTPASGKTLSNYSLMFGQKSDLSDGIEVTGTTNKSISFYNAYLGTNYFKVIANYGDGSKEVSDIKTFKVTEQCPRNLYVGNMPNCRDMGGRTTYAGGKIKQGLIYRTSGSKFDNSTPSNTEAKNILANQLRVKTEINVANSTTNNVNLAGTTVKNCYMDYGATPYSNLARNAEKIRNVIEILADENNYPVFYHCRIGTDRTGITGVMVGGLIGIKFNEIIQDYGFSNFAPIDNQRYPGKTPDNNGDDICKYIDEILALPGANFQEQTYLALQIIGIPSTTLDKVINLMTEGSKATMPATAKLGVGEALSTDVSKSTNTSYDAPATYYAVASGKAISYTATTTAGNKDIVVYMGHTDGSQSTKLASKITLKIDGVSQTIVDRTLHRAGFGQTQQNRRTGYMFNILGNYALTAGSHTIEISVTGSGTFNVATIGILDHTA